MLGLLLHHHDRIFYEPSPTILNNPVCRACMVDIGDAISELLSVTLIHSFHDSPSSAAPNVVCCYDGSVRKGGGGLQNSLGQESRYGSSGGTGRCVALVAVLTWLPAASLPGRDGDLLG